MVITPIFLYETCTMHCIQHTQGYQSMAKLNFFEKSPMVPFLIAGHILCAPTNKDWKTMVTIIILAYIDNIRHRVTNLIVMV